MNTETFPAFSRNFSWCVRQRKSSDAREILSRHPELIHDRNCARETALHWLAIENEIEGVRDLIAAGARVDCTDHADSTFLADCAGLGLVEMCRLLLDHGADPAQKSTFMMESALHAAARHTPNPDVIDLLAQRGAVVDAHDKNEATPLWNAVLMDNVGSARRLIAFGADRNLQDEIERRPIDEARSSEMKSLLQDSSM